ncbi:MAG: YfiR family protein [Candidatus Competibacter sp.]|nr:YfiR family protein [Candidatus Competibacter sp.]MDG4605399.1 YfiR family protein [Candidatus Contendobacter sp.]HRD48768.1 YfiR family protein [Candidatus Contendobacter sp.]
MVVLSHPPASVPPGWNEAGKGEAIAERGRRWLVALQRGWRVAAAGLLFGGLSLGGNAWAGEFDEYAVKAAYLYNFAKYVEWPSEAFAGADAPLWICVAGDNPFGGALAALSGKTVGDHPVEVRHLPAVTGVDKCHVVFVSRAEQGRIKTVLAKLARLPILTVSDIGDFARMGGMIGLIEADQRIRFGINLTATRQANLKLSSQLLKLATIVE